MSSLHDDLPVVPVPETAPAPAGRPHLRVVPDVPLDFDDAVSRLTPRLVRYAARRLSDRHEAEEVVQEALLRAYKNREALLTEDDLTAWSTCVTGRLVIDRLRVRGRSTSVADVPEGTRVGRDTADVVVARDEARTALDALDAMPARQAAVLWAREVEGLPYDEIGARFGMTEPAVRSILTRARKALRKEYAARGGTLPAAGGVIGILAPWAEGFTWLDKLRQSATRLAGPAALGVAGTALLGSGFLIAPATTPAATLPAIERSVVSEPLDAGAPAANRTAAGAVRSSSITRSAPDVAQQSNREAGSGPLGLPAVSGDALVRVIPDDACATTRTVLGQEVDPAVAEALPEQANEAGLGKETCAPKDDGAYVSVTTAEGLPSPGITIDDTECDPRWNTAITTCEQDSGYDEGQR